MHHDIKRMTRLELQDIIYIALHAFGRVVSVHQDKTQVCLFGFQSLEQGWQGFGGGADDELNIGIFSR
jgi:hypothetical protein